MSLQDSAAGSPFADTPPSKPDLVLRELIEGMSDPDRPFLDLAQQ